RQRMARIATARIWQIFKASGKSTHRDLQVSGELQESICRNKTTAYLLNAIPLPSRGRSARGDHPAFKISLNLLRG
ncbi:hypothetical protein, partial [Sinorhizobium meliloti]|uniref:hypothetical protein n=1 Tax=Rhizobium meliloti TaxID=382 RepID=UPI001AECF6A1